MREGSDEIVPGARRKNMKKFKGTYLLLIAILGVFAMLAGCSSSSGGDSDNDNVGPTGPAAVSLGSAGNFVILAETGVSNVPTSAIAGNIGLSPGATSALTGFSQIILGDSASSSQVAGLLYASDMDAPTPTMLTTAIADMMIAYGDAAGRTLPDATELGDGEIGGMTLVPGLYKWGTGVSITTDVTLSGDGVWIFQIGDSLTVASDVNVVLAGGAQAGKIFWQVAAAATLGSNSNFKGVILSGTAITLGTGVSMLGRAFAQSAVTMDKVDVTQP